MILAAAGPPARRPDRPAPARTGRMPAFPTRPATARHDPTRFRHPVRTRPPGPDGDDPAGRVLAPAAAAAELRADRGDRAVRWRVLREPPPRLRGAGAGHAGRRPAARHAPRRYLPGLFHHHRLPAQPAGQLPEHRRHGGAGVRAARPGQRRPRAGLLAGRLGAVLPGQQLRGLADLVHGARLPGLQRRPVALLRGRAAVLQDHPAQHPGVFGAAVRWLRPAARPPAGAARPDRLGQATGRDVGNRLSKIYTRTGDDGTTGLGDGTRIAKDAARVVAYGTVDEANSAIGLLLATQLPEDVRELLVSVQHQLFDLGGE